MANPKSRMQYSKPLIEWSLVGSVSLLSAIALNIPALAQSQPAIPSVAGTNSSDSAPTVVQLSLTDVVTLLLQNNLDLKNAALDRIVQRQRLREAESIFTPRIQPRLGLNMNETLFGTEARTSALSDTPFDSTAQVTGDLRTPLGSTLRVTVNPLESGERANITLTQPLLRGAGRSINQASVNQARLTETQNSLALRNTLMQQITQASVAYRAVARAQEALNIQQLSLGDQLRQLEFVQVLVDAGRRARVDLIDVEANVAATQAQVLSAQNALEQAKADLLNLLDLQASLNIAIPAEAIAQIRAAAADSDHTGNLNLDDLLQTAYANRPDYLQAQLDTQIATSQRLVAQDNRRWNLDLEATTSIGDNSQIAAGVILTRLFEDQSLITATTTAEVGVLQRQNDLAEIADNIRLDVTSRLRDVNSALEQITATQQSRELAERRLEAANVLLRRGIIDISQVLDRQNDVVLAQNEELNARIEFLDATALLEQAIGTTLTAWQPQVEASGLLVTPP